MLSRKPWPRWEMGTNIIAFQDVTDKGQMCRAYCEWKGSLKKPERQTVKSRSAEQKWKWASKTSLWNGFCLVSQLHLWNRLSNSGRQIIKEAIELPPQNNKRAISTWYYSSVWKCRSSLDVRFSVIDWGQRGFLELKNFFFFFTAILGVVLHYVAARARRTANFALEKEWERKKIGKWFAYENHMVRWKRLPGKLQMWMQKGGGKKKKQI